MGTELTRFQGVGAAPRALVAGLYLGTLPGCYCWSTKIRDGQRSRNGDSWPQPLLSGSQAGSSLPRTKENPY